MENLTIALQSGNLRHKISILQITKENLSEDLIRPLQFGSNSTYKTSNGRSVVSIETLNAELDAVAKKLAALSEATSLYLESVIAGFEEVDRLW